MQAFRASLFDFIDDPYTSSGQSYRYFKDGLLIVEDGLVTSCGEYSALENTLPENTEIVDYSGYLIMPGFIDTHLHYWTGWNVIHFPLKKDFLIHRLPGKPLNFLYRNCLEMEQPVPWFLPLCMLNR